MASYTSASLNNKQALRIAVVGATGNVGRTMVQILWERGFMNSANIFAVASERSQGEKIPWGGGGALTVEPLHTFDFSKIDVALFSPGAQVSEQHVPRALAQGCLVIDNTSHFRMLPEVPLVVPEVNGKLVHNDASALIANPNCSTIQLVMALKPLHDLAPIKRVVCATYQSVSGAGKEGIEELNNQVNNSLLALPLLAKKFLKPIAFNVIPAIPPSVEGFLADGSTQEEGKMAGETKKIMGIELVAHCVRVPVFIGHGVAVTIEFTSPINIIEAAEALEKFPGVIFERDNYTTPIECVGRDQVFISRLRRDNTTNYGLSLWTVADNVRKGAALNAIQIIEQLLSCGRFATQERLKN